MFVRSIRLLCDLSFFSEFVTLQLAINWLSWFEREHHQSIIFSDMMSGNHTLTKLKYSYWVLSLLAVNRIAVYVIVLDVFFCSFFSLCFWMFIFVVWTNSYKSFVNRLKHSTLNICELRCMGNISARNNYTNYLREATFWREKKHANKESHVIPTIGNSYHSIQDAINETV